MPKQYIKIRGANEHNLKNISLDIPRNELVVLTGLSGSGKSSLAFDTIYAEGQRRYMESLSSYARQFLGQMEKPDVESIEGNLHRPEIHEPQPAFHRRNCDRDLRLYASSVREDRYPPLPEVRQGDPETDRGPDGGPDHDTAGADEDPTFSANGPWKKRTS